MPQTPFGLGGFEPRRDIDRDTLKNFGGGIVAGTAGMPADMVQLIALLANRPPGIPPADIPFTSDKIAGGLGVDPNRLATAAGLLAAPGPGGKAKAIKRVTKKLPSDELTFKTFGNDLMVLQNPSSQQLTKLKREIRDDYFARGWNPNTNPLTRTTYDANGNRWVWSADRGIHDGVEGLLRERHVGDIPLNQNQALVKEIK